MALPRSFSLTEDDMKMLRAIQKHLEKERGERTSQTSAIRFALRATIETLGAKTKGRG